MKLSRPRRTFLRDIVVAGLLGGSVTLLWKRYRQPTLADSRATLQALTGRLMPAEAVTPQDVALLAEKVEAAAAGDASLGEVLRGGLPWFERVANDRYGAALQRLSPDQQDQVIALAEAAPLGELPRGVFDRLRHLVLDFALAQPGRLNGIPYAGPPLPSGYPDQARPPVPADAGRV